jgi:multidrug resistance efflux pump
MEIVLTALYILFIWLIWYKWKRLKVNLAWQITWPTLWVVALSLELIALGQFCPYSRNSFVWTYVYQIAPEYGGIVTEVNVAPNTPIQKGEPLFKLDPTPWQDKADGYAAQLAQAKQEVKIMAADIEAANAGIERINANLNIAQLELTQYSQAAQTGATSQLQVEKSTNKVASLAAELKIAQATLAKAELTYNTTINGEHTIVAQLQAELDKVNYTLSQTTVRAPADGYVVGLNLQPGVEIGLKRKVMTFISSDLDQHWIVCKVPQFGMKRIQRGDAAEVMLEMYPAQVFEAAVVDVVWATGEAQLSTTAELPDLDTFGQNTTGEHYYIVKLALKNTPEAFIPRFGATGKAAIYPTSAPDALVLLRKIELRMDSWISYLYQ